MQNVMMCILVFENRGSARDTVSDPHGPLFLHRVGRVIKAGPHWPETLTRL